VRDEAKRYILAVYEARVVQNLRIVNCRFSHKEYGEKPNKKNEK
jgi:hypothetical protein